MRTLTLGWKGKVETATGVVKDLQECCGLAKDRDVPTSSDPCWLPDLRGRQSPLGPTPTSRPYP